MQEAVQFLKEMIRLKSVNPPGDEEPVARLIEAMLKKSGIESEVRILGTNRANLVARIKGTGAKKSLVYSGHMDTVPPGDISWKFDPYGAVEHEGHVYGRGASDMKGGLAAMVVAMTEIARSGVTLQGDLVLAATAGEEVDCCGARAMVEEGLLQEVGAMVIGEPSNGEIFTAHKGALWLEITAYGKTAHGSMPEQGVNAIEHMNRFINALRDRFKFRYDRDHLLGEPTLNLSVISGGVKTNVVPDVCRLQIDIRTVPGQDHLQIVADVERLFKEIEADTSAKFELAVLNDKPSVRTPVTHELIGLSLATAKELFQKDFQPAGVRYFTDASVFVPGAGGDLPVIVYGPGDEKMAHQPDEFVETAKYLDAIQFYKALALRFLV
ncbi:M20 family metallopeptidase [Effusibacillus dendaii]|uniref:Succinyl-diaminopimelate desuccinylase n=1 Tax=Effusibacillus dendaii TaxID=2743772 RepID=A0A7I8DAU9_9BACL|nr:M20 family metallopeptidase [Effusibacillus dendaii]BCJ85956.1 succinyl-diaminopimelate desuccinylase [Effusibacillus dendaii]